MQARVVGQQLDVAGLQVVVHAQLGAGSQLVEQPGWCSSMGGVQQHVCVRVHAHMQCANEQRAM